MTSEVLMLNKDAVVIAADSAVTTGRDPHPRYSKSANKIFDASIHGNVAVTIFASADIDLVPWELVLKQFRFHDSGNPQRPKLENYVEALVTYLEGNQNLFPLRQQENLLETRFFQAALFVLERVGSLKPDFIDENKTEAERLAAWAEGSAAVSQELNALAIQPPLTLDGYQKTKTQNAQYVTRLEGDLARHTKYLHADATQLSSLATEALFKQPMDILSYTGLVFAGYGIDEIFPSFVHIRMYGHIGETMLYEEVNRYAITHDNEALILPFAQSSMIDRFTDGFDNSLNLSISQTSKVSFDSVVADLNAAGIAIPDAVSEPIIKQRHEEFMLSWKRKNWDLNFHPLRRVLNSLSVPEMGHLAESLLILEELRERVTSPSESIGGPIDVAVITKAEGLVWLKRKHYFEPELNQRYISRTNCKYN